MINIEIRLFDYRFLVPNFLLKCKEDISDEEQSIYKLFDDTFYIDTFIRTTPIRILGKELDMYVNSCYLEKCISLPLISTNCLPLDTDCIWYCEIEPINIKLLKEEECKDLFVQRALNRYFEHKELIYFQIEGSQNPLDFIKKNIQLFSHNSRDNITILTDKINILEFLHGLKDEYEYLQKTNQELQIVTYSVRKSKIILAKSNDLPIYVYFLGELDIYQKIKNDTSKESCKHYGFWANEFNKKYYPYFKENQKTGDITGNFLSLNQLLKGEKPKNEKIKEIVLRVKEQLLIEYPQETNKIESLLAKYLP